MNRPRKLHRHLPPCVYPKHGAYWHVKKGKWTRLGTDLHASLQKYAELFETRTGGIADLIDEAMPHITARAKPNTKRQYMTAAKILKNVLVEFAPEQVKQKHTAAIKLSLSKTPAMANTVMSVGKLLFDYWLEEQRVESNPFVGVRRYRPGKRNRLISREEFNAIYEKASDELQVIMDLWRLTGQRVVDVLRIKRSDLLDIGVAFQQEKTGERPVIKWNPELRAAVDRAKGLYGNIRAFTLLHNRQGKPLGYSAIRRKWRAACDAAGVEDAQQRDLRAVAATAAKKQGKSAKALLGHADERTTLIYLRGKEQVVVEGPSFRQFETVLDKTNENT
jgi:integrase